MCANYRDKPRWRHSIWCTDNRSFAAHTHCPHDAHAYSRCSRRLKTRYHLHFRNNALEESVKTRTFQTMPRPDTSNNMQRTRIIRPCALAVAKAMLEWWFRWSSIDLFSIYRYLYGLNWLMVPSASSTEIYDLTFRRTYYSFVFSSPFRNSFKLLIKSTKTSWKVATTWAINMHKGLDSQKAVSKYSPHGKATLKWDYT